MDSYLFYYLDSGAKIDYILTRLSRARMLFQLIYDNIELCAGIPDDSQIEAIGDKLVAIGIQAEDGEFDGLYEYVNETVEELEFIAETIISSRKLN